jgi:hypothetical protein
MGVFFSLLTPSPSERGRLMMFCLSYGIESIRAKKMLKREIPEGETLSERGQKKALPPRAPFSSPLLALLTTVEAS